MIGRERKERIRKGERKRRKKKKETKNRNNRKKKIEKCLDLNWIRDLNQ